VGTGLSTVALTLLAYDLAKENAGAVIGFALACKMIAYVVFAPIIGGLAHRFPRKPFLISMDVLRAGVVLLMPFVTQVWQIYVLIFVLNLFSAGFKPVFTATIPDIITDEEEYTKALSLSRVAYDLESLLSPTFAWLALLFFSYTGLFVSNSIAFGVSAILIAMTSLTAGVTVQRIGTIWDEISFGTRAYLKTPRLVGMLCLYVCVACASSMVIVNTVVYIRENLGMGEADVAIPFAAAGLGSMIAALSLPRLLERTNDRSVMLSGGAIMFLGLSLMALSPSFVFVLAIWFIVGVGWSLVQTPAGRILVRSSNENDRSAYFSAQFALSHACWLVMYPIAGQLVIQMGFENAALVLAGIIVVFLFLSTQFWSVQDDDSLVHRHETLSHDHAHVHDEHHAHAHAQAVASNNPHSHVHTHKMIMHKHRFVVDEHHMFWPGLPKKKDEQESLQHGIKRQSDTQR